MTARALVVLGILVAAPRATADERPARVAVDFAPPAAGARWFAAALEEDVARALTRFAGVALADKLERARCPDRSPRCLVAAYRAAGVDVVVLGALERRGLAWAVWETWTPTRASDGRLRVDGVTAATLERRIGEIIRPIVQHGGLLDQRPVADAAPPAKPATPTAAAATAGAATTPAATTPAATTPAATTPTATASAPAPAHNWLPALLVVLALLVALPPLVPLVLVRARERKGRARPSSRPWSIALAATLAALAVAARSADVRAALAAAPTAPSAIAAGMVWGAFALVVVRWVFSPIGGLGQIRHDALWSLLRSWAALSLLRALLGALALAPILFVAMRACAASDVPERVTVAVVLPAVGLVAYFCLLALVDNLTLFLDVQLVIGPATERNPWHGTIRRYCRGYLRRNGADFDGALFARTLFLPSLLPKVVSYGGGFARPRIVVGEPVREAALGGLPDEDEFPDRTVNPDELPWGLLVPGAPADEHRLARAEKVRTQLTAAPARKRGHAPRLLGESATMLGWVLPQPGDSGVPLIANTVEDYEIVKRLLTEHYAAFERNSDDDEVDDTDPTQRDFLFGALIRELGAVARRDTFLTTVWYSVAIVSSRRGPWRLLHAPIAVYERFLAGPAARVADAFAALNHGLHHLIQYLCYLRGTEEAKLTRRANEPALVHTSRDLIEHVERDRLAPDEKQLFRATPRNRVLWLSQFFHAPIASRARSSVRFAVGLALAFVGGLFILLAVENAADYHIIWLERMRSQAAQSTQGAVPDVRRPETRP